MTEYNSNGPRNDQNDLRDYGGEIDRLKGDISDMKEMLGQLLKQKSQPEQTEATESDNSNGLSGEPSDEPSKNLDGYEKQWGEYGRHIGEYGQRIAERMNRKAERMSRKAERYMEGHRHIPKPPKPPKPQKTHRTGIFYGADFESIGGTVKRALDSALKGVEETLRNLDVKIDMVDLSFKPMMDSIEARMSQDGVRGVMTYMGGFKPFNDQTVYWSTRERTFDEILSTLHSADAEKVLSAMGSRQKLDILLALLHAPMTVNELVAYLHLNSTGQAYHHLHSLLASKVVVEEPGAKGTYTINPDRVQGLLMILAGVRDLLEEGGEWREEG